MDRNSDQRYSLLPTKELLEHEPWSRGKSLRWDTWKITSLVSLLINLAFVSWTAYTYWPAKGADVFPGILQNTATTNRIYTHFSNYSSADGENPPALEALWEDMVYDHGFIAVDHEWAEQQHLPPSRALPSDPSKDMYLIDAYHSLHCVGLIRKAFYQLSDGHSNKTLDKSMPHYSHCFDHLKQSITCTASDGLFAIHEDPRIISTGDWDTRQCRDWGALRDWAAKHTPCVGDVHKLGPYPHDFCHGADDRIQLSDQFITQSDSPYMVHSQG